LHLLFALSSSFAAAYLIKQFNRISLSVFAPVHVMRKLASADKQTAAIDFVGFLVYRKYLKLKIGN